MLIGICGKKQSGKNTIATILSELFASKLKDTSWTHKSFAYKVKQILSILTGIPVENMEMESIKNSYLPEEWNKTFVITADHTHSEKYGPFYSNIEAVDFINKKRINHFVLGKYPITVRQALQWIGTDLFRNKFDKDTWINALFSDYITIDEIQGSPEYKDGKYLIPPDHGEHSGKEMITGDNFIYKTDPFYPNWIITDVRFLNEAQVIKDKGGFLIKIDRPFLNSLDSHSSESSIDKISDDMFDYYLYNDKGLSELYFKIEEMFSSIVEYFNLNR